MATRTTRPAGIGKPSRAVVRDAGTLGVFTEPAAAAAAIRALNEGGHSDVRAAMPAPFPEVVAALQRPKSRVGWWVLAGGLTGTISGFGFCVFTALSWPLVTGGKPIVSVPPYAVVAFELTVLAAALTNVGALTFILARFRRRPRFPAHERFSGDTIGVFVVGQNPAGAVRILTQHGASEVRHVA
ncbi:MAG: DUF3341 domain-containing protein [Acidobacteriia bacterium]|nr:DUF3341 domain-containing protein [Terriglobia bacterium]